MGLANGAKSLDSTVAILRRQPVNCGAHSINTGEAGFCANHQRSGTSQLGLLILTGGKPPTPFIP
jgi:hypothetical protein